ncbi:hypothetical protein DCAR_0727846 [Daucus carota subsp. sativus]|uniref:CASP-like protein n=1 Tax=Daucus carota subsp. sativus TaxID=79200 RepID=A0A161X4R2_DAUCS|nr:PREDICTED: CASP-like protein 1E2 [Daucus carota subsp. sativus]WOH08406.1 hypothetical protein DCAR_0727846 [Daucus carota subsp. sativus]
METEKMNKVVVDEEKRDIGVGASRKVSNSELFIRFMALLLSLAAALVLAFDKQTEIIPVTLVSTLPPLYVPATAKFHYLSAFTYFVVANAVACAYGAVSFIVTLAKRGSNKRGLANWIIMFDLIMVALLASGSGAAAAVGVLGYNGNEHVRWNKVCNVFGKFCNLVKVSVGFSLLGLLLFMFLVMIAVVRKR